MSSVSTYLNFPGNTEEAFNFYKSIFKTEFKVPISRFGDIPPQPGMPPMPDADKSLVMHVELPITGGHILMGTDAPESFGFNVNYGNNVHIALQLDNRDETSTLFEALSADGKVTMPLADMFWGAYYGSCTDKFGVQWMFNCYTK
ncbi:MAG: VOC family protein [Sphingobacteriales bacterium]|nr:VOC family protein [Sphingobacteriales bacterium]